MRDLLRMGDFAFVTSPEDSFTPIFTFGKRIMPLCARILLRSFSVFLTLFVSLAAIVEAQTAIYSNQGDMGNFGIGFQPLPVIWDDLLVDGGGTLDEISIVLWHGAASGRTVSGSIDLRLFDETNNIPQGSPLGFFNFNDTFDAHPSSSTATLVEVVDLAAQGIVLQDGVRLGVGIQLNDDDWSFPGAGPPRIGSSPGDNWLGNLPNERQDATGDFAWRLVVTGTQDSVAWNSPISGTWENDYNWDTGFAPLPSQDVTIGGVPNIAGPIADTTVKSLTLGIPTFASETLQLQPGVTLNVTNSLDVVHNGLLDINGSHIVTPNFNGAIEAFDAGSIEVTGGNFSPGTSDFKLSGSGLPSVLVDNATFNAGAAGTPADVMIGFEQDESGALTLQNGSAMTAKDIVAGGFDGSEGELVVKGAGTTLDLTGKLTLGQRSSFQSDDARGVLRLEDGAVATVRQMDVGEEGLGLATIDNATLNVVIDPDNNDSGNLIVGGRAESVLTVQNGGVVNAVFLDIATFFSDSSLVVVTGYGSEVNATSGIAVGQSNEGKLHVLDGATVTTAFLSTGLGNGLGAGEVNEILIDGPTTTASVGGTLRNSSGALTTIRNGAQLVAGAGSVTGGTLNVSGTTSLLDVTNAAAQGASLFFDGGQVTVEAGAELRSSGLISGSSFATADANFTVTGRGSKYVSDGMFFVIGNTAVGNFNVFDGATAERIGDVIIVGDNAGTGTVNVSGNGSQFTVDGNFYLSGARIPGQVLEFTGVGTLNVQSGATVEVSGTIEPFAAGQVNVSGGKLRATEISLASGGGFSLTGGQLSVDAFAGNLVNDGGAVAPGQSAGITNVAGIFDQNAGSLEIEIFGGGTTPGVDFDQLNADTAELGGVLDIIADSNYVPTLGDTFEIVTTAASLAGNFASVVGLGLGNGLGFEVDVDSVGGTVTLEVVASSLPLTGDYNGDGIVTAADYTEWRDTLGTTVAVPGTGADGNVDGIVTEADYHAWQIRYAANTASLAASENATVPEPATGVVLSLAIVCFLGTRRRVTLTE